IEPGKPFGAPAQLSDGESGRLVVLPLDRPAIASDVTLRWDGAGSVILRSVSLIDQKTGASQVVVASPDYELVYLGDVKIYRDRLTLPHAYLARGLTILPDDAAALDA